MKSKKNNTRNIMSLQLLVSLVTWLVVGQVANAAALTTLSDTMTNLNSSGLSNHDISFVTPTGVASGATIILTFQSDFSINASLDFTDIDVLDNGANVTLAAAPSGATWGAVRTSATVITLTNGTTVVTAGHTIRIKIGTNASNQSIGARQITNTTTTGNKAVAYTGTFGDFGTTTVPIITNDTVALTAQVDQSITFTMTGNSAGFGTLSAGAAAFATTTGSYGSDTYAHTMTVGTNAANGYNLTVNGYSLMSGSNAIATSSTAQTSQVGSSQFGLMAVAAGAGTGTVTAPYATASQFAFNVNGLVPSQIASASVSTANNDYHIHYIANISSNTAAGSYSTTLTYVATANY